MVHGFLQLLNDVTMEEELVVEGEFHDKNDPSKESIVNLLHIHKMKIITLQLHLH